MTEEFNVSVNKMRCFFNDEKIVDMLRSKEYLDSTRVSILENKQKFFENFDHKDILRVKANTMIENFNKPNKANENIITEQINLQSINFNKRLNEKMQKIRRKRVHLNSNNRSNRVLYF